MTKKRQSRSASEIIFVEAYALFFKTGKKHLFQYTLFPTKENNNKINKLFIFIRSLNMALLYFLLFSIFLFLLFIVRQTRAHRTEVYSYTVFVKV